MAVLPEIDTQMILIGGNPWQIKRIKECYPQANPLETEPDATIEAITKQFGAQGFDHLVWICPDFSSQSLGSQEIIEAQNQGVLQVFRIVKALLFFGVWYKSLDLDADDHSHQAVRRGDRLDPTHGSVHGFDRLLSQRISSLEDPVAGSARREGLADSGDVWFAV